jgi:hypothetical protein
VPRSSSALQARHAALKGGATGFFNGLLEESGRPRFPVTEQITGSNPVQTAKFFGLVVYRLGWETFNLSKWVQLPPGLP